jgi:hypothetical protein
MNCSLLGNISASAAFNKVARTRDYFSVIEASTMALMIGSAGPASPSWRWMISPFSLRTVMRLECAKSASLIRRYWVPRTTANSWMVAVFELKKFQRLKSTLWLVPNPFKRSGVSVVSTEKKVEAHFFSKSLGQAKFYRFHVSHESWAGEGAFAIAHGYHLDLACK